jgi:hypothetical protein
MRTPEQIFERAQVIVVDAIRACDGDSRAAIVSLVGSDAVCDLLIEDYGNVELALQHAAFFAAEKETMDS